MNKKIVIYILFFLSFLGFNFAADCGGEVKCNCGDTVTSSYVLNEDLVCDGQGLRLRSGSLNCNGFSIIGNETSNGIYVWGSYYSHIFNCNIENFSNGIYVSKRKQYSSTYYTTKIKIHNNNFSNNEYGIKTNDIMNSFIFSNKFENNNNSLYLTGTTNKIYNNDFYDNGIFYPSTGYNEFCRDGVENNYFRGAKGPSCGCYLPFDGLLINSNAKICPGEYNLSSALSLRNRVTLDCQGSILNGNGVGTGILIKGYDKTNIKNCVLKNFSNGVYVTYRRELSGTGWGGLFYTYDNPTNNNIFSNKFEGNEIAINSNKGSVNQFYENDFKNNNDSIYLVEGSSTIWGNSFYDKVPSYFQTKGNLFCKNGKGNEYLGNLTGPSCDCMVPREDILINSKVNFCKNNYNLPLGLKLGKDGKINCQGSYLIGEGTGSGIIGSGVSDTEIINCNIYNYDKGVYLRKGSYYDGYRNRVSYSYYNKILNSTIFGVNSAIYLDRYSVAENINNNILLAKDYGVYHHSYGSVDATNNWWGTDNESLIEEKINRLDTVSYKPYLVDGPKLDFYVKDRSIEFERDKIWFGVYKEGLSEFENLEVLFLDVLNGEIIDSKTINYSLNLSQGIFKAWDKKPKFGHIYIMIINPEKNIYESDFTNNYLEKKYIKKPYIYLNISLNKPRVAYEEVIDYLNYNFGKQFIVDDLSEAEVVLNFGEINFEFFRKPYEGEIISKLRNDVMYINITAQSSIGQFTTLKRFVDFKDIFMENETEFVIEKGDVDAIGIYDYFMSINNYAHFMRNSQKFREILRDVLFDGKYYLNESFISIDSPEGVIDYRIWNLKSKNSNIFQEFVSEDMPVVMGGGLWSDITTWEELGNELANSGYDVYLIEITGGENSECDNCYNYPYEFLTDEVYPSYLNYVLNSTGAEKLKYVGHSNGARVALDSLSKGEMNPEKIDALVAVGVPGAFEGESFFKNRIIQLEKWITQNTKDISHVQMFDLMKHRLVTGESPKGKISTNLWRTYFNWMNSTEDLQPAENLEQNQFMIVGGNYWLSNDDGIVTLDDERAIYENINSIDEKYFFIVDSIHVGMSEEPVIKKLVSKFIKNKDFNLIEKILYLEENE